MDIKKMPDKIKVLVTGGTGFIGRSLIPELLRVNYDVSIVSRKKNNFFSPKIKVFLVEDFKNKPDFSEALIGIDCVIHLANKAHMLEQNKGTRFDEIWRINVETTLILAKQAIKAGVKRFIFLSSISVNGNQSIIPFMETEKPNPQNPYAMFKLETEQKLLKLTKISNMDLVIIRAPLVYALNAKGNFGKLIKWVRSQFIIVLPFALLNNAKSFVSIDNLVSFIILCIKHSKSANELFVISDNEIHSTKQIIEKIAKSFNKKVIFFSIPINWMIFIAKLFGKKNDAIRLFSSLVIDNNKAKNLLGWYPISTMDEQLSKIIENEKNI
jgi:nucleoside-diphosphate-sugar epimerase